MKRTQIIINKPVHLGLSTLEINKIVICEFWYDYVKAKYRKKAELCYKDTDRFNLRRHLRRIKQNSFT